jgi:hypothetical protein
MSTGYMSSTSVSDHDVTLAIPGDIDTVRLRLIKAIHTLGYKVLSEQPLYAKRGGQGACSECSLNVLDYPTTITISLKQMNEVAVVATFSYEIKSYIHMTKGDRQTLAREAEAMVALATERLAISTCIACGTPVTDESHFFRRCGAPLARELAEVEVLRLTRGSRASYHSIFVGVVALILAALTVLPVFVVSGARIYQPLMWVGISLASYALFALVQGIWQLHRTLNPKMLKSMNAGPEPTFAASVTAALPPAMVNAYVTEGTTELLVPTVDRRVSEPIRRKEADTAEIDTDRLM